MAEKNRVLNVLQGKIQKRFKILTATLVSAWVFKHVFKSLVLASHIAAQDSKMYFELRLLTTR